MKDYSFLNRAEYFTALTRAVLDAGAGDPVIVQAMNFNPGDPAVAPLIDALGTAARRGAKVTFLIDAYNFLASSRDTPGPLFYQLSLDRLHGPYARIMRALETVEAAGGSYCITNIPRRRFSLPVAGRSHIKAGIVGSRVFVGGCNLHKPRDIDVMVTWEDDTAANILRSWLLRIAESGQTRLAFGDVDAEAVLDHQTHLIIDAGVPHQSLIYEEALRLIDEAQEWLFITCQYFPGGPTAKHLTAAAARGVKVEIAYSHPRAHGPMAPVQRLHQLRQRTRRLPSDFFTGRLDRYAPNLHAKVLASEHCAMVGSHNYVIQGVNFGTAELALRSTDPAFARRLCSFIKQQITQAARHNQEH